ncbi:hypothetical protein SO694_00039115 [Aureococcus anophagefferens]|uniref:B30.2/SPRY domain-containing protein n=1 Tax=Aureococcus anophagefferens TaxID=44056 RepID=A0ABR1FLJ2_AURAN
MHDGWTCGEDCFSYAYNGVNGFYVHENEEYELDDGDACWSVGDVVGCLLDLDGREIRFSVNGAYDGFAFDSISVDSSYIPVLSMAAGVVDVNYGERDLKFLPEGYNSIFEALKDQQFAAVAAFEARHRSMEKDVVDLSAQLLDFQMQTNSLEEELATKLQNPDSSGALYVLGLLDKLDEAARGDGEAAGAALDHPGASGSSPSVWRRASVEDYGRSMRLALEDLAESDRLEIERIRQDLAKYKALVVRVREGRDGLVAQNQETNAGIQKMRLAEIKAHFKRPS